MAGVYAANTLGGHRRRAWREPAPGRLGGIAAHRTGAHRVSIAAGLLLLLPRTPLGRLGWCGFAVLLAGLLIYTVPPIAKVLIAHGRYAATWVGKGDIVYAAEGMNSSVAVSSFPNGVLTFHVAGKIQASNVPRDMRLQRMLGHLTTLTAATPSLRPGHRLRRGNHGRRGVHRSKSGTRDHRRNRAAWCRKPLPPTSANRTSMSSATPRSQVRIDDGRHYLLTTKERFDGITVDPLDPWVKGAANLYTKEFLEVMKQHLNPGGVVTMYIQLFETDLEAVKSSVATFFEVFPNGTIWGNPYQGQGHDMVLLGQVEPLRIDLDEMEQRFGYRGGAARWHSRWPRSA